MRVGQVILFSKDKLALSRFLTDLFELSPSVDEDAIRVQGASISFLIIEREKLAFSGSSNIVDFFVESYDELEAMHKKVEFIYYRYEIKDLDGESKKTVPSIKTSEEGSFFFITDPDNRRWKISYFKR